MRTGRHRRRSVLAKQWKTIALSLLVVYGLYHTLSSHASLPEDKSNPVGSAGVSEAVSRRQQGGTSPRHTKVTTTGHRAAHPVRPRASPPPAPAVQGGDATSGDHRLLSAEVVGEHAWGSQILVTFANANHADFILNWVRKILAIPMDNYLVVAFDEELMDILEGYGYNCALLPSDLERGSHEWGAVGFKKLNRFKWDAAQAILEWGFDLFITDADTVFFRNPFPWLREHDEGADLVTSTDMLHASTFDGGLEIPADSYIDWWANNIGMMYLRSTPRTIAFFRAWTAVMADKDAVVNFGNQLSFTQLLRAGVDPKNPVYASNRTFWCWNDSVVLGILPTAYFANGHTFFQQKTPQKRQIPLVAVHSTYVYAMSDSKRHRFREFHLWEDEPAYYTQPSFLMFDNVPPPEMLVDTSWDVPWDTVPKAHLALVDYQVQRVLEAQAIAQATGRTLIMPRLFATCDRYFAQLLHCRLPAMKPENMEFPMNPPADHYFRRELLVQSREWTFLQNPRTPAWVAASRQLFDICDTLTPDGDCLKSDLARFQTPTNAHTIHVAKGKTDVEWREFLKPFQDVKVLHFSSMEGTFAGFQNTEDAKAFAEQAKTYVGAWCCTAETGYIPHNSWPEFVPSHLQ